MAHERHIIVPHLSPQEKAAYEHVIMERIPLRIRCPNKICQHIFTLWVENFDQEIRCLLGQACPVCKRFLKETDDPAEIFIDAKEVRKLLGIKDDDPKGLVMHKRERR